MDPCHVDRCMDAVERNAVFGRGLETVLGANSFGKSSRHRLSLPRLGHAREIGRLPVLERTGGPKEVQGRRIGVVKALLSRGEIAGVGFVSRYPQLFREALAQEAVLVGAVDVGQAGAPRAAACAVVVVGLGGPDVRFQAFPVEDVPRPTRHHGFCRKPRAKMAWKFRVLGFQLGQVGPEVVDHEIDIVSREIKIVKFVQKFVVDVLPDGPGFLPHVVVGFLVVGRVVGLLAAVHWEHIDSQLGKRLVGKGQKAVAVLSPHQCLGPEQVPHGRVGVDEAEDFGSFSRCFGSRVGVAMDAQLFHQELVTGVLFHSLSRACPAHNLGREYVVLVVEKGTILLSF